MLEGKAAHKLMVALVVLCVVVIAYNYVEINLERGDADAAADHVAEAGLLHQTYKTARPLQLRNQGYSQINSNYPIFPAQSEMNNNLRYWQRPTNGQCSPPELCGAFYADTPPKIEADPSAPAPGGVRVNYYDSHGSLLGLPVPP